MTDKPDRNDWDAAAHKEVRGRDLTWHTPEGIAIQPLYTAEDTEGLDFGLPGFAPFTRGPYASMYTGRPWTIRQYAGFSTAEESNAFYRRNLAAGQKGLSVAFDLATHRGYGFRPSACGRRCRQGGRGDRHGARHGNPVRRYSIGHHEREHDDERRGDPGAGVLHSRGGAAGGEPGAAQRHDPERHSEGVHGPQHLYLPRPSRAWRIVSDIIAYTSANMPKFNSISISGYHMHEAGATAVQELAFTSPTARNTPGARWKRGWRSTISPRASASSGASG